MRLCSPRRCPPAWSLHTVLLLISVLGLLEDASAFATPSSSSSSSRLPPVADATFRRGIKSDEPIIAATMARSFMNPLDIDSSRFVVAENSRTGERMGWAQLRPLGPAAVDPDTFDASPGSVRDLERVTDDEMWDLFEEEETEFPNGWSSLPWTKEYRAAAEAASKRLERRAGVRARVSAEAGQLWELASVYVREPYRGRGVGSELVRRVMAQHAVLGRSASDVYALTLASTVDWYRKLGFNVTEDIPSPMRFEVAAGRVITKLIGAELVCLRGGQS